MTSDAALPAESIGAVIGDLCACWNDLKLSRIETLWDAQEREPYCLPQELEQPLIGWPSLREYLRKAQARLSAASMRYWNLNTKRVATDLAVALYEMHWNGLIVGATRPMGVDTRVTALLRHRNDTWRLCHYVEAPVAFSLHLQHRYFDAVDHDFLTRIGWDASSGKRYWPDGTPR